MKVIGTFGWRLAGHKHFMDSEGKDGKGETGDMWLGAFLWEERFISVIMPFSGTFVYRSVKMFYFRR